MASPQTKILQKKMLKALEKTLGIVSHAAKIADVDRSVHYDWMERDEEYRKKVEDICEIKLDFVESALHKNIQSGDTTAIIFALKTLGKKRGYSEKYEIQSENNVVFNWLDENGIKFDG
jgi:uncharacterized protein YabN with tetrapyrrole methylase and pyrophosphatase domain